MFERQTPTANYYPTNVEFARLTSAKSIQDEILATADALVQLSDTAIVERQETIVAEIRKNTGNKPRQQARYQELNEQLSELDYLAGHYRHRARQHKYEMERHPQELWLDASDGERTEPVRDLIERSPRLRQQYFTPYVSPVERNRSMVVVEGDNAHAISVPVCNLIHAEGFTSWEEGRQGTKGSDKVLYGRDRGSSQEIIEEYANRETPFVPVEHVVGYIQPNGIVVYAVLEGTHRAGAAIRRGDVMLATKFLQLVEIDENLVSLDETGTNVSTSE